MKRLVLVFVMFLMVGALSARDKNAVKPLMIGDVVPSFVAETTTGRLNFPDDFGSKWKVVFSHPRNFTPVCSSEILELGYSQAEFDKLGAKVVVISTDTKERHLMWKKAIEEINLKGQGTVAIKFPLVDDSKMTISHSYGMLHDKASSTETVRGVFYIGPDNTIRATQFYPMAVGRNIDEIKRTLYALQLADKSEYLTPANWHPGDDVLVPHFPYTNKELEKNPALKDDFYSVGSLLWYKKQ